MCHYKTTNLIKIRKIQQKVDSLIQRGKEEFKTHKVTKYCIDSEYSIVYSRAVDFLIENYNQQTADEIDKLFDKKIPKIFDNKE